MPLNSPFAGIIQSRLQRVGNGNCPLSPLILRAPLVKNTLAQGSAGADRGG
jgi:hypothetical protein